MQLPETLYAYNEANHLVDNEYSQSPDTHAQYFAELEAQYREGGIVVPL